MEADGRYRNGNLAYDPEGSVFRQIKNTFLEYFFLWFQTTFLHYHYHSQKLYTNCWKLLKIERGKNHEKKDVSCSSAEAVPWCLLNEKNNKLCDDSRDHKATEWNKQKRKCQWCFACCHLLTDDFYYDWLIIQCHTIAIIICNFLNFRQQQFCIFDFFPQVIMFY